MALRIFNSLTRRKDTFSPIRPGHVRMYVCGPTVYADAHLGHARCYIAYDMVARWLRASGYRVTYFRNVTDVDDRIIEAARKAVPPVDPRVHAQKYYERFSEELRQIGVLAPDREPRALDYIEQMQEIIATLIEAEHAYALEGDVYFSVPSYQPYGRLTRLNLAELRAGARVIVDERKRAPADFALWKAAK